MPYNGLKKTFLTFSQSIYRMFTRTFSLLLLLLLGLPSLRAQAPQYGIKMDTGQVEPNQITCRPVLAKGFSNIISFQHVHHWDENVLQYHSFEYVNLPSPGQNEHKLVSPNSLTVAWASILGGGISIPNGQIVYKICFTAIAPVGSSSAIYADGQGLPPSAGGAEAYNTSFQDVWNSVRNEPGLVQVVLQSSTETALEEAKNTFELRPNPTQSTAQVRFNTPSAGTMLLSITDATGRRVLEQKIVHSDGENTFQIPQNALISKGLYQITLQNGKEISTQILSVL